VQTSAGTLQSALDQLSEEHPQLVEMLLSRGELSRFVNLYVDGENVRHTGLLSTNLPDGAEVMVIPAVAGG
jgi:molybdopterin converting factor small subunit